MQKLAMALVAGCMLALSPALKAQESFERSLADVAASRMKEAAGAAWRTAQELSEAALGLIGVRYRFGGESPDTGLDCSGFVRYVFQEVTGVTLPRTAQEMSRVGDKVGLDDLKPGDLVFFNTRRFAFSHVGIYLGDNQFIHAPSRGREVEIAAFDKNFWQQRFNGARRLIHAVPNLMPSLVSEAIAAPVNASFDADVESVANAVAAEADTQP